MHARFFANERSNIIRFSKSTKRIYLEQTFCSFTHFDFLRKIRLPPRVYIYGSFCLKTATCMCCTALPGLLLPVTTKFVTIGMFVLPSVRCQLVSPHEKEQSIETLKQCYQSLLISSNNLIPFICH